MRTPTHGCSLLQNHVGEAFPPLSIPCNVGEGWGGIYHQQQWKDEWGSCPYGDLSHGWGT